MAQRNNTWRFKSASGFPVKALNFQDELEFRKAEESADRRFQATEWLRRMDPGAWKTLPEKPTEMEFCLALRNGLILCNALNIVTPGAVPKIVENSDTVAHHNDRLAQSAIQCFENVRNFLIAVEKMKLLRFEASDLEKGGSSNKVVDCIICLKGFHEWKLAGGNGTWRYGGIVRITSANKDVDNIMTSEEVADELVMDSLFPQKQHLFEFLNSFSDTLAEDSNVTMTLENICDEFALTFLNTYSNEWNKSSNSSLKLELLSNNSLKERTRYLLKEEFKKVISIYMKGKTCVASTSYSQVSGDIHDDPLGNNKQILSIQQKKMEELRSAYQELKVNMQNTQTKWDEELITFSCHLIGLEQAANSYYKLLEENRQLYNQVEDLKGSIRVYCRVKPFLPEQCNGKSVVDFIGENGNIIISSTTKQRKETKKIFSFDKVFGPNVTQEQVFADTQPLIRSVLDGYNVCIFAYGQTGSGKTYTMSGPNVTLGESWGVNYRALNDLFQISNSRRDILKYEVRVQMIEIYNEQVRDLLVVHGSNNRLDIRNNSQLNGVNIPDASLVLVKCTEDVLNLMMIGHGNRAVGDTALNERSSRSHSVLTVHVQGKELLSGSILRGCLHLVDLAGSERVDKSEAVGDRLKEAQHINKSLSALGDVIYALAQKSGHIPYRNSKLTQVLQDALDGQSKTLMLVHINPDVNVIGETVSTLKFAQRVASVTLGAARVNRETNTIRELKEEIARLNMALEIKDCEVHKLENPFTRKINPGLQQPSSESSMPLHQRGISSTHKLEENNQILYDVRNIEIQSLPTKQHKSRSSTALAEKEIEQKSSLSTYMRSLSLATSSSIVDGGKLNKMKPKLDEFNGRSILMLQHPEKISANRLVATVTELDTNESLSKCRTLIKEPRVHEKLQCNLAGAPLHDKSRKKKLSNKAKLKPQLLCGSQTNQNPKGEEDSEKNRPIGTTANCKKVSKLVI